MDQALFEKMVAENHPDESEGVEDAVVRSEVPAQVVAEPETPAEPSSEEPAADPVADEAAAVTGHDRTIVKAARAAERAALKRADRLEAELNELRAKVPVEKPYQPDAVVLEQLEDLDPRAAAMLREAATAKATPAPAAKVEPDFMPEQFDDAIQDEIDSVPELAAWQADAAKQADWKRAKAIDVYLSNHPDWASKPMAERLTEVVRLRKAEVIAAKPASKPTAEDAQRVIAAKAETTPVSVADVRGRTPSNHIPNHRLAWKSMSKEQILADLPE